MKPKLVLALLASALIPAWAQAQKSFSNPVGANITVADAGTCSTTGSFLWQQLPNNAGTTTINLAGTFSATVTVRESNNGGGAWTTATTLSAAGTSTFSTNGFTDICADVTAYTSGTVQVSISTGLQQVQSVVSGVGGSGSSPGVFSNTQYNSAPLGWSLNGCSPSAEYQLNYGAGLFSTDTISACVNVPFGANVQQVNAISAWATSAAQGGVNIANTVAGFFAGRNKATQSQVWALNPLITDFQSSSQISGHTMTGIELDVNVFGAPAFVQSWVMNLGGSGSVPLGTKLYNTANFNNTWRATYGFYQGRGTVNGVGLYLGSDGNLGGSFPSQSIVQESTNASTNAIPTTSRGIDFNGNLFESQGVGTTRTLTGLLNSLIPQASAVPSVS